MNAARRKRIADVVEKIGELLVEIQAIQDEEQEAFDNMPESLQSGGKGEKAEAAIDSLQTAYDENEAAGFRVNATQVVHATLDRACTATVSLPHGCKVKVVPAAVLAHA